MANRYEDRYRRGSVGGERPSHADDRGFSDRAGDYGRGREYGPGAERMWRPEPGDEDRSYLQRDYDPYHYRRASTSYRGEFTGRGPKGYQRSDARIHEDVCDRLADAPYLDASNIEVSVNNCEVTLSGYVFARADKREAEDVIENITGVREIHNNLRVNPVPESPRR
jgi:osmotically-inducible protein OsmY